MRTIDTHTINIMHLEWKNKDELSVFQVIKDIKKRHIQKNLNKKILQSAKTAQIVSTRVREY